MTLLCLSPCRALVLMSTWLFLGTTICVGREEHPMMHAASEKIRAAQSSAHPIEDLEKARRELRAARDNKGGYRAEAIQSVDGAIAALKAGKRVEADKFIKAAITAIEKGVALHPRDRRRR